MKSKVIKNKIKWKRRGRDLSDKEMLQLLQLKDNFKQNKRGKGEKAILQLI